MTVPLKQKILQGKCSPYELSGPGPITTYCGSFRGNFLTTLGNFFGDMAISFTESKKWYGIFCSFDIFLFFKQKICKVLKLLFFLSCLIYNKTCFKEAQLCRENTFYFLKVGTLCRVHFLVFCPFTYISILISGMQALPTNRVEMFQCSDGTLPSCKASG